MKSKDYIIGTRIRGSIRMLLLLMLLLSMTKVEAQIMIGGSVYGGGNAGDTGGNTTVKVYAGDITNVFGGARMANVGGRAFVDIEGENASADILIANVYGGNDISGTIGTSTTIPTELKNIKTDNSTDPTKNSIDNRWNAFVRTSACTEKHSATIAGESVSADKIMVVIGSLYGGGNGDYSYKDTNGNDLKDTDGNYIVRNDAGDTEATSKSPFNKPELARTYLELKGGCIAHVYGGGNNATVTINTTINIDNPSDDLQKAVTVWAKVNEATLEANGETIDDVFAYLQTKVKLSTFQSNLKSFAFNFARVFGGNNKAAMAIRPTWNLQKGIIRDIYSGGNQGDMTYSNGILLHINPAQSNDLKINNVYGGCRMANVNPAKNTISEETINGIYYPEGYAARLLIEGGDINNVYGGNDISGNVYGGNAVGIHSSINGDVYGGGNGSYAYTDNEDLGKLEAFKDYYYNPGSLSSVEALRAFRPNAESVSIRLVGTAAKPTIIGGAVYCGGNSATLHNEDPTKNAAAELKIGSYVIADKVFLGNNGVNMKDPGILELYAKSVDAEGNIVTSGGYDFSQMNLASETKDTDGRTEFDKYMDGVTMDIMPRVVFDDVGTYVPYSTYFGSFYCGGNVGSMKKKGAIDISFNDKVVIFNKVVGGSNEANVYKTDYNAQYLGGLLGDPDADGNKLILNFNGLKIQPMRWNSTYAALAENEAFVVGDKYYTSVLGDGEFTATSTTTKEAGKTYYKMTDRGTNLIWNTVSAETGNNVNPITSGSGSSDAYDLDRRLKGGNVYGGCYNNGHVNGNVIINLNATLHERDKLFDVTEEEAQNDINYDNADKAKKKVDYYTITERNTGVILSQQGTDCFASALNVFGGGYGGDSEIWGNATINLNAGYAFQIFGGGEMGAIGNAVSSVPDPNNTSAHILTYEYNKNYSTYINLNGDASLPGVAKNAQGDSPNMAECEYLYGGAFEGVIAGNTHVYLGNGRIFNSFGGSCNANILGHVETYIGSTGFPYVRDYVYGGNDLGGKILNASKGITDGDANFTTRIRDEVKGMVDADYEEQVEKVAAYVEYTQGRVNYILGGGSGNYDYKNDLYKVGSTADCRIAFKPYIHNTFVNFRPNTNANNEVSKIFGAGEGYPGDREGDKLQDHSYVLIDIPNDVENFANMEVFGAGAYNGLGMDKTAAETFADGFDSNEVSAITDLMRGKVGAAYGGSYEQGVTRRTVVNVPVGSTIKIGSIFGGAYGSETYQPCDVYEANVNYHSADAYLICDPIRTDEDTKQQVGYELLKGAIYGGNNQERRTLYGRINIDVPVKQKHYKYNMTTATVYGAGYGPMTWNEYTEVNLNPGASVWEVYGGGEAGGVMSAESAQKYIMAFKPTGLNDDQWKAAWSLGSGYDAETLSTGYAANQYTNLNNPLVREAEIDDRETKTYRYNTNVIIHKDAYVGNYAYGGGLGKEGAAFYGSGDVYGSTYIALLGGIVSKDIYAAGTVGAVYDFFGANFIASTNAYIAGGMLRNVYGGGWKGDLGRHTGTSSDPNSTEGDILGEAHVVIGIRPDQTETNLVNELKKVLGDNATKNDYGFYAGEPAIQRNAYGGGEGGAIFGSSYLTINNGYIGYVHLNANQIQNEQGKIVTTTETTQERYEAKIHDDTYWDGEVWKGANRLADCGNIFGGGYDVRSSVDETHVTLWNGTIRNSMHGGGEIATIGRGAVTPSGQSNSIRTLTGFYKAGKTNVEMFNGHVLRNVFGGGKGYNIYGYGQEGTLYTDGYVFGQTEVHIHGGEVGTDEGLANGYGNVFGGGDIGYVYGPSSPRYYLATTPATKTGTGSPGHFYYYDSNGNLEEDCKVVISPWLQVRDEAGVTINGKHKDQYEYFETEDLNTLVKQKDSNGNWTNEWNKLFTGDYYNGIPNPADPDERGVKIHNAVFGGGNVSSNSDQTYANATTVYGNATATLNDIFHRDFITVGTEHTGGIYGGGNLSVVDGYRELNITNYGTDYYGLSQTISIDEYRGLSNRERAYFQLEYECLAANHVDGHDQTGIELDGKFFYTGQKVKEEDYVKLLNSTNPDVVSAAKDLSNFKPYGFCSIYAGRLLNTIQRADLCGVFGSRMVLQGAKDRVAEVGEDIDYTINRVGELSLNKQRQGGTTHGNYFGIYSLVNYLGNMTSDVHFSDEMVDGDGVSSYFDEHNNLVKTVEINGEDVDVSTLTPAQLTQYGITKNTYYGYKSAKHTSSDRNKGESFNQVALASGVFLELTTENSTKEHKDYGYVTGVIELDLINVKRDQVGGGFVYAKNEHRVPRRYPNKQNVILSEYNKISGNEVCTYKQFRYSASDTSGWPDESQAYTLGYPETDHAQHPYGDNEIREWQTSGNFIHHEKRIVDDCYPTNNAYIIGPANYSDAHYWYVKGDVYIYDQKVSAYTGSANAYSKAVNLPLTITAASHGQLQLLNVKPNLYAYKMPGATDTDAPVKIGSLNGSDGKPIDKVTVNNESDTYKLNDVVSWWDWHLMSPTDQQYFVTNTYVNCVPCQVDGVSYEAGTYVMDDTDFNTFKNGSHQIRDAKGEIFKDDEGHDIGLTYVFRSSNNISHETGYVLTFDMNSPKVWDDYYTPLTGVSLTGKKTKEQYEALFTEGMTDAQKQAIIDAWREGPTFTPKTGEGGVYGKRTYTAGDVITKAAYNNAPDDERQNKMKPAYVATKTVTYTYDNVQKTMNPGAAISETEWNAIGAAQSSFAPALFVTNTVKLSKDNYMLYGELKTAAEITTIKAQINADPDRNDDDKAKLIAEIDAALTEAYILIDSGTFGGQQFDVNTNYGAIEAWCSLPSADRDHFNYNYDALDLLVSSSYLNDDITNTSTPSHESTVDTYHAPYTDIVPVEYQAVYDGDVTRDIYYENSTTPKSFTKGASGATIENTEYETIRNDKKHYTHVITTKPNEIVYITKTNFVYLGTPYGVGQVVDVDVYNANTSSVDPITFVDPVNCYYCYEAYTKKDGTPVGKGAQLSQVEYMSEENVPNYQQYFVIQGKEPTETTTLYVSRESNAYDVMSKKIITVVYQYTYNEDDDDGSVKKTNELHVINIHLELESGAPVIGLLKDPPTVLPGNAVGLSKPDVNPGLYEVLNSGWELFSTSDDAASHRNGVPFENNGTPVYWYQNQKNWVAFYSRTWLGKTYSNSVPLSVANYHDLDKVMKDKEHHLYVDKSNVDRPCKIYLDNRECESDPSKNELDLLKDFFDLSLVSKTGGGGYTVTGDKITATTGTANSSLENHSVLDSHVHAGRNLEFFLNSDIDHSTKPNPAYDPENPESTAPARIPATWTSIGYDNVTDDPSTEGVDEGANGQCFEGILHGDGYTISGIDNSLFAHLCGEVYNLGVTGTFTGAGIAEEGSGYLENCWVATTSTANKTAQPVFGNPSRSQAIIAEKGPLQVVNSYYKENDDEAYVKNDNNVVPKTGSYTEQITQHNVSDRGTPVRKEVRAFYNGEVAYDLNGFYLHKRYYQGSNLSAGTSYSYLQPNADGSLPDDMATGYYPNTYALYRPVLNAVKNELAPNYMGYVESRFYDGDYRYADGTIPESTDIHMRTVTVGEGDNAVTTTYYVPIWPDDYIFFGQTLNYGYIDGSNHQDNPSHIYKSSGRLLSGDNGNRVYRAPAYFGGIDMKAAYFNPNAVFAKSKKDEETMVAYKGMTAIDFTGYNDVSYQEGLQGGKFYPPLLDDGGLTGFTNVDLTQNLLAYAPFETAANESDYANKATHDVLDSYFSDLAYQEVGDDNSTDADETNYHRVAPVTVYDEQGVRGHVAFQTGTNTYIANRDHILVDKNDFYCPIPYTFTDGSENTEEHLMWYQRKPDLYVDRTKGWQDVSLPFTADLVTTHQKGEITHFYGTSSKGHEYWLREYKGGSNKEGDNTVFVATLERPAATGNSADDKTVENTFLWDYYYNEKTDPHHLDTNTDEYQTYYNSDRSYSQYSRLQAGVPYLIGFPGATYYEFDLSGTWAAYTTASPQPVQLDQQVITFVSKAGAEIKASNEATGVKANNYTFVPNFLNRSFEAGTANTFVLNAEGSSYDAVPAASTEVTVNPVEVYAFRPYFTKSASAREVTRSIIFSEEQTKLQRDEDREQIDEAYSLSIYAKRKKIVVESNLREITEVRIVNTAGITMNAFTIEPGETVTTRVNNSGVYIVQTTDGRYTKKLAVR